MAPRQGYRQPQVGNQGFARTKKVFGNAVVIVAADVALNAQVAVLRVPRGFVCQNIFGTVGDLDTGVTLMIALGDAALNSRFLAANAIGQAGGAVPALAATGLYYEFLDDTDILMTATVAATALGPTPFITLYMEGWVNR